MIRWMHLFLFTGLSEAFFWLCLPLLGRESPHILSIQTWHPCPWYKTYTNTNANTHADTKTDTNTDTNTDGFVFLRRESAAISFLFRPDIQALAPFSSKDNFSDIFFSVVLSAFVTSFVVPSSAERKRESCHILSIQTWHPWRPLILSLPLHLKGEGERGAWKKRSQEESRHKTQSRERQQLSYPP